MAVAGGMAMIHHHHRNDNAQAQVLREAGVDSRKTMRAARTQETLHSGGGTRKSHHHHHIDNIKDCADILHEDEHDPFKAFFNSGRFDVMICPLILLNVLTIGVEIDQNPSPDDTGAQTMWLVVNSIWNVIWFIEMCVKMYCLGKAYFEYGFNRFDLFLIFTSIIDTWVLPFIPGKVGKTAAEWSLTIRILRILRLIRFVRIFENLWHIVDGFIKALNPLSWTALLLFFAVYASGVYMTLVVGHRCQYEYSEWSDCEEFFGRVHRSMWSLIQVLTLDAWSSSMARVIITVKPFLTVFFLAFLMGGVFGMLNVIVGIIVESTLESKKDLEKERVKKKLHAELDAIKAIFQSTDEDGSGEIDYDEFSEGLKNPNLINMFDSLGFDAEADPRAIFDMLDHDHTGFITIEEFVDGILQLKNPPTRFDVYTSAKMAVQRCTTSSDSHKANGTEDQKTEASSTSQYAASNAKILEGLDLAQQGLLDAQKGLDMIRQAVAASSITQPPSALKPSSMTASEALSKPSSTTASTASTSGPSTPTPQAPAVFVSDNQEAEGAAESMELDEGGDKSQEEFAVTKSGKPVGAKIRAKSKAKPKAKATGSVGLAPPAADKAAAAPTSL